MLLNPLLFSEFYSGKLDEIGSKKYKLVVYFCIDKTYLLLYFLIRKLSGNIVFNYFYKTQI